MSRGRGPDQYHQQLVIENEVQTEVDSEERLTIPLPIPRFGTPSRPYVFELTKIHWLWDLSEPASGVEYLGYAQLSTVNLGFAFADPRTFWITEQQGSIAAAGNEDTNLEDQFKQADFTDGGGKGLLIGSDNIYLYFNTNNTNSITNKIFIRLFYRLIRVSSAEYIGIVQSQQ